MTDINDLVDEAIEKWKEVAGIDLEAKSFRLGAVERGQFTVDLYKALELDSTGITTAMMLRGYFEWYLKEAQFSAFDIILNPEFVEIQIEPLHELRNLLESPVLVELMDTFRDKTRRACYYYAGDREDMESWITNKYQLAVIRRDALRSMETLETHQFTYGQAASDSPRYNLELWEFWNINSLILTARAQLIPGISVCLLRDPVEPLHSYFGFVCVNGETITFLTDRGKSPHPAYKSMSRRPDREMEQRAEHHRFPYQTLDLIVSEDQKKMYAKARTGLVPINAKGVPLSKIGDLFPDQLIWLTYMFELISERYYVQDLKLPELSYTGEMVRTPNALVDGHSALARQENYKFLEMPILGRKDVTTESTEAQWERKPQLHYTWMVERYGEQVPDSVLDVVGPREKSQLTLPGAETKEITGYHRSFQSLDAASFGSKKDLEKDRIWSARVNQMVYIQKLAEDEFQLTKDEILTWYKKAVLSNAEFLLDASVKGQLLMERMYHGSGGGFDNSGKYRKKINVLHQVEGPHWGNPKSGDTKGWDAFSAFVMVATPVSSSSRVYFRGQFISRHWDTFTNCYDYPDIKGSIFAQVSPQTPSDLALLCGVEESQLPWQLQHFWKHNWEPYTGNSILDRLDPIDWTLNNPWKELRLSVGVVLSKRAYSRRRERLGLPWANWWK